MNVFTLSHGSAVEHSSELSVDYRYMSVHLLIRNTTSISSRSSYLEQVFLVLASCYFVAAGILEVDALTVPLQRNTGSIQISACFSGD